jgi:hypothetical protein
MRKEAIMADAIIFVGWDRPIVGREKQAMQLFQKVTEYNSKLQADRKIESFEVVILRAHGGDLNGFILLKGDAEKLSEIQREDTFVKFTIEAHYCLQGYGVVPGYTGAGVTNVFSQWAKLIGT